MCPNKSAQHKPHFDVSRLEAGVDCSGFLVAVPPVLAAYIAVSAARIMSSAPDSGWLVAMPTLADRLAGVPSRFMGCWTAVMIRSAVGRASTAAVRTSRPPARLPAAGPWMTLPTRTGFDRRLPGIDFTALINSGPEDFGEGQPMSEHRDEAQQSGEAATGRAPAEMDHLGSLSVEDDEAGTEDPAEVAGTANSSDDNGLGPSVSEAD